MNLPRRAPTYGYTDVMFESAVQDSIDKINRHRSKMGLLGAIGAFALPIALPAMIGTLGTGAAALGEAGATTGWMGKMFPKLFTPEKVATWAKSSWFQPVMKSMLSGGGYTIGARLAGKRPDVPFGRGGYNELGAERRMFGGAGLAKMGTTFMGAYAEEEAKKLAAAKDTQDNTIQDILGSGQGGYGDEDPFASAEGMPAIEALKQAAEEALQTKYNKGPSGGDWGDFKLGRPIRY